MGEVSELSRSRPKVASFGDGVEGTPRPITTAKRSSVSAPVDPDILLLQSEEYPEGGKGDTTRERSCGDAESEQTVSETRSNDRGGSTD